MREHVAPEPVPRRRFYVPIREQALAAVKKLDGPNATQILELCDKGIGKHQLTSELSRMCRTYVIRAVGDRPQRYYENK
jgi:hypothetical protein